MRLARWFTSIAVLTFCVLNMAAFLYWRLNVINGGGSSSGGPGFSLALAEWKFFDAGSAQIPTTGGTAAASTAGFGAAANAFDGDINTFWGATVGTSPSAPQWIQYQFPSPVTPASFSLTARNDAFYVQAPDAWQLQASNDGVTWTPMGNYSLNAAWTSDAQVQTFTVDPVRGTGSVWRILITSNASTVAATAEITFFDLSNNPISLSNGQASAIDNFPLSGTQSAGPSSAFDGDINTYWGSIVNPNTATCWIQYRFSPGAALPPVGRICVTARNDSFFAQAPLNVTFQYSTDNITFFNVRTFSFSTWTTPGQTQCATISEPVVTCDSPPSGTVGIPYTHTFPVTGGTGPYVFSITGSLPTGLTLNSSTGVVSGTPTAMGTFPFTVGVTDANMLTGTVDCSITIGDSTLAIVCGSPPGGTVGIPYTHTFPASGGTPAYTFSITVPALPTGVNLDTSNGVASGTPAAAGVFSFTIQVTDSTSVSRSVPCSITIADNLAAQCNNPPPATGGVLYSHTITTTGGTAPLTFSLSGTPPPGLTIDPVTGIISGVPVIPSCCAPQSLQVQRPVVRDRIAPHIFSGNMRIIYNRIQFELMRGVGLDGNVFPTDPVLLLRWSNDAGNNWGPEQQIPVGKIGQFGLRVLLNRLGYGRDRVFWLRCSDPVQWGIVSAELDIVVCSS